MPKRRKLNSSNPKWKKDENVKKTRKELAQEVKGVKIYKVYYL